MDNEYHIPELNNFINRNVNPIHSQSNDLMQKYLLLHALVYYFEYAVGAVRSQERALQNKYTDAEIVSSAIAAYVFMRNCLGLADKIISKFGVKNTKRLDQHKELISNIKDVRNRFIHPNEDENRDSDKEWWVISKRKMISTDGRIVIPQKFILQPKDSRDIELYPRKDLEKLRQYLKDFTYVVANLFYKKLEN
jgi:hypothetical protein